jgi:Flp pilus assembly protein TadD
VILSVLLPAGLPVGAQTQGTLPDSLLSLFQEGVEAQKAGHLEEAERAFRQVLAGGGKVAFVYNNLGIVYQSRREHEKAVTQFREAIHLQPDYGAPRILLGASLLALGRTGEAAQQLERAVKLQPREPLAREQLARAYERGENFRGVVEQYRALLELQPNNPEYLYQLGGAYLKLAAWCHRQMAAQNPNSARVLQSLAESYRQQGHPDLAAQVLRRAAKADPTMPEVHYALALIYLEKNKPDEARQELEKELAIVPSSVAAQALLRKLKAGP